MRNATKFIFAILILIALAYLSHDTAAEAKTTKVVKKEVKQEEKKQNVSTKWTESTWEKYNKMIKQWFDKVAAKSLINHCKATAKDPVNCIRVGSFTLWAESSMGNRCYNNNCVWMNDGWVAYKSIDDGIKAWVGKYNKFWYNQKHPRSFYRDDGIKPVTRYCMGIKKDGVCKEWYKNAMKVYTSLNF